MRSKERNRQHNRIILYLVTLCAGIIMISCATLLPYADVATDYLTVKVGYSGMELSEYVEAGRYHWRELRDSLELHKEAYSYFQSSSKTKYTAIVDSAQGFYIADILGLANIYTGDVRSLKFYVEDSKGIRTSFDSSSLFSPRYYYDDLAGHRTVVYGTKTVTEEVTETVHHEPEYRTEKYTETVHHDAEYTTEKYTEEVDGEEVEKEREVLVKDAWDEEVEKERQVLVKDAWDEEVTKTVKKEVEDKSRIIEYRFDEAARHAVQVQPMLAIEDNWAQFSEEFEHIGPDFSSMNAGNRFRLLFGQKSPVESLTSMSDKYVSCVYVLLDGKPEVGEMGELDGKLGSHTVEMTVSADNTDIRDSLSKLVKVDSTNKDVLVVTGISVTPDNRYSDIARVTVSYDIVGRGEASLTVGVGSGTDSSVASKTVTGGDEGAESPDTDAESSEDPVPENGSGSGDPGSKGKGTDQGSKGKGPAGGNDKSNGTVRSADTNKKENSKTEEITDKKNLRQDGSGGVTTYELSEEAAKRLMSASVQEQTGVQPDEIIAETVIKDNTEEQDRNDRKILALTGLGFLFTGALGSAAEMLSFSIRLKGRITAPDNK